VKSGTGRPRRLTSVGGGQVDIQLGHKFSIQRHGRTHQTAFPVHRHKPLHLRVDGVVDAAVIADVLVVGGDAEQHRPLAVVFLDARLINVGVKDGRMVVVVLDLQHIN